MSTAMNYQKKDLPKSMWTTGLSLLGIGFVSLLINFLSDHGHHERFWSMYIVMFVLLISLGVGSLFIIAIEHLVGAFWSVPYRRVLELLSLTLPFTGLLGIPLLFQLEHLFHWYHPGDDVILIGKSAYLDPMWFIIRYFLYFVVWSGFAVLFHKLSLKQEKANGDQKYTLYNIRFSAIFVCLMALSLSFAAIDWIMSLEPHWFSTMFGVYYFAGTVMVGFCLLALFGINLHQKGYLHPKTNSNHYYPIATFMFAFNCFWCYIAFCQFMLIWYGNLPEESFFYQPRWEGNWMWVTIALMILHFPIPFYGLISRPAKTNPKRIKFFAVWLIGVHILDMYWLVMGSLKNHETGATMAASFKLTDLGFLFVAAGIVLSVFYFFAKKVNLVAVNDPKLNHGLNWHP